MLKVHSDRKKGVFYPMKFFIDTANVDEIRKANDMGVICGVTTNPSLIAKEGRDYAETLAEIASFVDGPISGEVKATHRRRRGDDRRGPRDLQAGSQAHGRQDPDDGGGPQGHQDALRRRHSDQLHADFLGQSGAAGGARGRRVCQPFLGRLDDISQPGIELIRTIAAIFANYPDIRTQIIAASVRNPIHVTDCALAGADIATVPYKVIEQMTHHPLTDQGIEKFRQDYVKVFGE